LAYLGRGILHSQRQEFDAAIADYDRAIALRPENAQSYVSRGQALRQTGNLDRALADFERAITLAPQTHSRGAAIRFGRKATSTRQLQI
jgi:tetratricopeptide (TPR) repeat protein